MALDLMPAKVERACDTLGLVMSTPPPREWVEGRSLNEIDEMYEYALGVHLRASDNFNAVPAAPACLCDWALAHGVHLANTEGLDELFEYRVHLYTGEPETILAATYHVEDGVIGFMRDEETVAIYAQGAWKKVENTKYGTDD